MRITTPEPLATEQPEDTRTRGQLIAAIESLHMRGLAPTATLGRDLNALDRDQLLALEAKAKQERLAMDGAHASARTLSIAHWHATHQSREQVLSRSRRRVREPEPPMAA